MFRSSMLALAVSAVLTAPAAGDLPPRVPYYPKPPVAPGGPMSLVSPYEGGLTSALLNMGMADVILYRAYRSAQAANAEAVRQQSEASRLQRQVDELNRRNAELRLRAMEQAARQRVELDEMARRVAEVHRRAREMRREVDRLGSVR